MRPPRQSQIPEMLGQSRPEDQHLLSLPGSEVIGSGESRFCRAAVETAAPERNTGPKRKDLRGAFNAKVVQVDNYLDAHGLL